MLNHNELSVSQLSNIQNIIYHILFHSLYCVYSCVKTSNIFSIIDGWLFVPLLDFHELCLIAYRVTMQLRLSWSNVRSFLNSTPRSLLWTMTPCRRVRGKWPVLYCMFFIYCVIVILVIAVNNYTPTSHYFLYFYLYRTAKLTSMSCYLFILSSSRWFDHAQRASVRPPPDSHGLLRE